MQTAHHQASRFATLQAPVQWALVAEPSLTFVANLVVIVAIAEGRFGIYLDGAKVYDRKDPGEDDFAPKLQVIRKITFELKDLMEATEKVAP